jgi:rhodanese-related sulfurtransferase
MSYNRIHPIDLMNLKKADICILDVRTSAEAQAAALPDSLNIPLHELTPEQLQTAITENNKDGSKIYLLCQAGRRAEMAADQLSGHIDAELYIIEGGMDAIQQSKIPLRKVGKPVISLERQVRIAAGFLVFTGVVLGGAVSSWFYGLAGFVGAGLMFAGITDTCMMGMLIARMPWNR